MTSRGWASASPWAQDRATLYLLYGVVLVELGDTERAEEALREALRVNPVSERHVRVG